MTPTKKTYFWSATFGALAYVLGFVLMYHELHPTTAKGTLTVILLPLCLAVFVSAAINLKLVKPHKRKHFWRLAGGMTAYVLSIWALNHFYPNTPQHKYWLVLLPLLPLIFVATSIIRAVSEADEMLRKIQTEAMAFSGLATGFTCFSYLFLRDMGAPEFHAEWAFYMMWNYYFIGLFFSRRRYR
jgi:hypothetical protein